MSKLLSSEKEVLLWLDKSEKAALARLEKHYRDAMEDVEMKIFSMLGRNDANLPHVIRRIEYQRMLKEQIQTVLERLHSNEYETISQYLTDSYTDAFVGTMYTLHQQDVPLILPIDQSVVMKAVTLDSKLKESLYTTMGKDMTALKKTVAEEVTRGIATGQEYSEIARNIRYAAGIPLRRAKTIARTEASRVQEQATFDAATEAKASGADVVKQWSSRRDGQTRDTHRMLDGQVREVDEAFTVNGKKAMHPHGFGVAELDINCRCTMLTRARAALDEDTLKKLEERAQEHGLLAKDSKKLGKAQAKNIAQFKEKYLEVTQKMAAPSSDANDWSNAVPRVVSKEEKTEIIAYAAERGINIIDLHAFDGDSELLKAEIRTLSRLKAEFGFTQKLTVTVKGGMVDDDFAETNGRTISFNAKMLRDRKITENNIAAGNTFASRTLEDIAAHEFGHLITLIKGNRGIDLTRKAYYNIYGKILSNNEAEEYLEESISAYSVIYDRRAAMHKRYDEKRYKEIISEVLAKHNSHGDRFTEEFIRLLKEER